MQKGQKRIKSEKVRVRVRDLNILASIRGEIQMSTRCTAPNKRAYKRKQKHTLSY